MELDAELIAATALAIVDAEGLAGFSMRAVARALDVTPMALYHHVRNKADLAALVIDAANAEQPLPSPTGDWREDLWLMAKASRESMIAHPHVIALRRLYRVWTPDVLQKTEYWMSLWQQSGLPRRQAVRAAAASSMAILGLVEEESVLAGEVAPDATLLDKRPGARQLLTFSKDASELFELAVRSLIEGLHERLSREK